jgi:hypothetical protein
MAPLAIGAGTPRPTTRNAVMTLLLPALIIFGSSMFIGIPEVVGAASDSPILMLLGSSLGSLGFLVGGIVAILSALKMMTELRALTKSDALAWWGLFIPFYNLYLALIVIPTEVNRAKQALNVQEPTRNVILYWLLFQWAMASDLNDIAKAMPPA